MLKKQIGRGKKDAGAALLGPIAGVVTTGLVVSAIAPGAGTIGAVLVGVVAGIIVMGVGMWLVMPSMMIVTKESALNFDETVAALEKAILEHGWSSPGTIDLNQSFAKHGVQFDYRVKIIQLCKADYAKSVLTTDRYVACLMPCSFAVWETDEGKIFVSKMNTGLMGKMFGGNIAKIMGGAVAKDEHAMLGPILK